MKTVFETYQNKVLQSVQLLWNDVYCVKHYKKNKPWLDACRAIPWWRRHRSLHAEAKPMSLVRSMIRILAKNHNLNLPSQETKYYILRKPCSILRSNPWHVLNKWLMKLLKAVLSRVPWMEQQHWSHIHLQNQSVVSDQQYKNEHNGGDDSCSRNHLIRQYLEIIFFFRNCKNISEYFSLTTHYRMRT